MRPELGNILRVGFDLLEKLRFARRIVARPDKTFQRLLEFAFGERLERGIEHPQRGPGVLPAALFRHEVLSGREKGQLRLRTAPGRRPAEALECFCYFIVHALRQDARVLRRRLRLPTLFPIKRLQVERKLHPFPVDQGVDGPAA